MAEIKKSYVNDLLKLSVNGESFLNVLIDQLLINGTISSNSRVMTVGGSKMMSCLHPGHNDYKASFGIDLDTGTSNCFGGCGSTNPHGTLLLLLNIDTKNFPTYGKQISEVISKVKETFKTNSNFISQLTQIERENNQKSKNWNNNIFDTVLNNFEATNKEKKEKLDVEINKRLNDRKDNHLYGDKKVQISPKLQAFENKTLMHVLVEKELTKRLETGEIKTFKDLLNTGFFAYNRGLNIDMTFDETETLERYVDRLAVEDDDVNLVDNGDTEERNIENLIEDLLENNVKTDIPIKLLDFVTEPGLVFPIKDKFYKGNSIIEKSYGLVFKPDFVHNENYPKYKNIMNPEHKKGDHFLFQENLFFERPSRNTTTLKKRRTWVTEGVFDGVALNNIFSQTINNEIENKVITSAGSTLTDNQIKKLESSTVHQNFAFKNQNNFKNQQNKENSSSDLFFKTDKTPPEIVVSLDFDKAGYIGALKTISGLLKSGLLRPSEVKSISKPEIERCLGEKLPVKDLDDLLKNKKVRELFKSNNIVRFLEDPHNLASRVSVATGVDLLENKTTISKEVVSDLLQFTVLNIHLIYDVLNQANSESRFINKRDQILQREELEESKNPGINTIKDFLNVTTTEGISTKEQNKILSNCQRLHTLYVSKLDQLLKLKLDPEIDKLKIKEVINTIKNIDISLMCQQRASSKYNDKPIYLNLRSINYKTKVHYLTKKPSRFKSNSKSKEVGK